MALIEDFSFKLSSDISGITEPTVISFLKCFSLYKTFGALTGTNVKEGQVLCLNGIRVFSINWVVLGHIYLFVLGATGIYIAMIKRRNFQLINPHASFKLFPSPHFKKF